MIVFADLVARRNQAVVATPDLSGVLWMPKLIAAEVTEKFFELLCSGSSVSQASLRVGVAESTGRDWCRRWALMELLVVPGRHGGLAGSPPRPPCLEPTAPVRRSLSSEDRAVISACLRQARQAAQEPCFAEIGRLVGRHRSVIKREIERNSSADGSYWAPVAHRAAHERRRRPKQFRLLADRVLARRVEAELDEGWSPKLIATMLRHEQRHGPASGGAGSMMGVVSHETIYQALYVQSRGELRQDLHRKLSLKRSKRVPRGAGKRNYSPYQEALRISARPPSVEDRAVPGHWEGDLIKGAANGSQVGTLVERSTRFVVLLHLPDGGGAEAVAAAMIQEMSQRPRTYGAR